MNNKSTVIFSLILFSFHVGYSSAPHMIHRSGTLSEILCDKDSAYDIFTCRIIENYKADGKYYHTAVVEEVFRGSLKDTILITLQSSGTTSYKMIPSSEHLMFASKQNNGIYLTAYHRYWHSGILNVKVNQKFKPREERTKKYLSCVRDYYSKVNTKYTGSVELKIDDYFVANGYFKNGQPEGEWKHQDLSRDHDYKTTINYKEGQLHGEKFVSYSDKDELIIPYIEVYRNGNLIASKRSYSQRDLVNSRIGSLRYTTETQFDSTGSMTGQSTQITNTNAFFYAKKFDGYYLNKNAKIYSRQDRAEGWYDRGAKVGQWSYYDESGQLDSTEVYSVLRKIDDTNFVLYYPNGTVHIIGQRINGLEQGPWKEFNEEGQLVNKVNYNDGKFTGTLWRSKDYSSEYVESKRNGYTKSYNKDGELINSTMYKNGLKDGPFISYYSHNEIKQHGQYNRGFKVGIHNHYAKDGQLIETEQYDDRGALYGSHQFYKNGKLREERNYLNGYKSGDWTQYFDDKEPKVISYPTELDILMADIIAPFHVNRIQKYDPKIHSNR